MIQEIEKMELELLTETYYEQKKSREQLLENLNQGYLTFNNEGIIFEGATDDAYETTLSVADPTADRVITIPNSTMTCVTTATHASKGTHISRCIALG